MKSHRDLRMLHWTKYCLGLLLICFPSLCRSQQQPQQPQQPTSQQNQYHNQAQTPELDQSRKHIDTYAGTLSEKHRKFYLQIAHTKTSYELVDAWEAKRFLNKKVRVSGWLDVEREVLHVSTIARTP